MNVEKKETNVKKILKLILKIIENILIIFIIFMSLIIVIQRFSNNENSFLGFRVFRVQTGSMVPKYQVGDVLLVKEKDKNKIKVGDDLVYEGKVGDMNGKIITHQVIEKGKEGEKTIFHTKGIANSSEDPIVYEEQINGVVNQKLYTLTYICQFLNNKYVFYFAVILPLTIYIFFRIISGKEEKIRSKLK